MRFTSADVIAQKILDIGLGDSFDSILYLIVVMIINLYLFSNVLFTNYLKAIYCTK